MGELRDSLKRAWLASVRRSTISRAVALVLDHPSYAGLLLYQNGSARAALDACPPEPWFAPVRDMLRAVADEDLDAAGATVIRLPTAPRTVPMVAASED